MEMTRSGAAVQAANRPTCYYNQARPDVAALVPSSCRRLLEVGCGEGHLGRLLQARGHRVTGLELVAAAAELARPHLDAVIVADVETDGFPLTTPFDAIIFA